MLYFQKEKALNFRLRVFVVVLLFTVVATGGLIVLQAFSTPPAQAAAGDGVFIDHPGLVPDEPERGYPRILTTPFNNGTPRQTLAVDLIGPYIVSGGDFHRIELQNGNVINQRYLAVFDTRDQSLACSNLDVDDEIFAFAPGPRPNTMIMAGSFKNVNGADGVQRIRNRIALVDLDTCLVDRNWIVEDLNFRVTELAVTGNRLFIAGDFTSIEGTGIDHIAEVSLDTGELNRNFDPNFRNAETRAVVGMEASPDGTRLAIVHRATQIMGVNLRGTAIFNISDPNRIRLTGHRMDPNSGVGDGRGRPFERYDLIQDGTISPDFSTIVLVQGPGTEQDYVTAFPTVERQTDERWQLFIRDTTFSAAASNDVVYIAGHFCKIDEGPGNARVLEPFGGPNVCDGAEERDGVFRTQMAALDLDDGTPLNWNPGNTAQVGGRALTVVNRGLLFGFDGDRTATIRTGTTAFYDFGPQQEPTPPPPPTPASVTCSATLAGNSVELRWTANDAATQSVRLNGSWVTTVGDGVSSFTHAPGPGTHEYVVRLRDGGQTRNITCNPSPVTVGATPAPAPAPPPGGALTCTSQVVGNQLVLTWTGNTSDSQVVRRNGGWVATLDGGATTYSTTVTNGNYLIRVRIGGATTDIVCQPGGATPAPAPNPVNVALGRTTSQSSTGFGGVSSRAVDGNTSGVFRDDSVTHTVGDTFEPWWQVDLGARSSLSTIELWNRTDGCCTQRLDDAVVFVSDTNMAGRSIANLEGDPSVTSYDLNGVLGRLTTIDADTAGRYVRVHLRGTATLSLAEVRVFN